MANILISHGLPEEGFAALQGHTLIMPPPLQAFSISELTVRIADADAVIAAGALPASVIRAGKRLKVIVNYGAGYDKVDIAAAAELGIPVTNIPDTVTDVTAELAVGLMLAVARRIGEMNLRLRREAPESLFGMGLEMGVSLRGKTLGILGCGRIGGRVAELSHALGMRVIGFSRHGVKAAMVEPVHFDELLTRPDVLSLHCPLTEETRGLISREALARMKPGALLINTARGAVVDHDALADAVASGHLAGAGLDVYPDEPKIPPRLLEQERIVLTPHIGSNTREARREMARACAAQVLDVLQGKQPEHIVNGVNFLKR